MNDDEHLGMLEYCPDPSRRYWLSQLKDGLACGIHPQLVFIEDVLKISNSENLDGPENNPLDIGRNKHFFQPGSVRFRTSGTNAIAFLESEENFERLETGNITDEQRHNRRGQLVVFFRETSVPIIDLYFTEKDIALPALKFDLVPGGWHLAWFNSWREGKSNRLAMVGPPGLDGTPNTLGELTGRMELIALLQVPPWLQMRLLDIFSLNHVKDATLGETGEEGEGGRDRGLGPGGAESDDTGNSDRILGVVLDDDQSFEAQQQEQQKQYEQQLTRTKKQKIFIQQEG